MRKRKGFTLAELLIVVAIIGVLVAIAIPVFTSSLEKAREGVCLSNRTSLYHEIIYDIMLDPKLDPTVDENGDALTSKYSDEYLKDKGYICPSKNGKIVIEIAPITHIVSVGCEKHGLLQPSYDFGGTVQQFMSGELQQTIVDLLKKYNKDNLPQIDSSAPSGGNYAGGIIDSLKKLTNHALGEGVTKTWSLCNVKRDGNEIQKTYQVYWSGGDINTCTVGDKLLMMYYDANTGNYETRWMAVKQTGDSSVAGGKKYNVIDTNEAETIKKGTFEEVYTSYLEEIEKNDNSEIKS